MTREEAIHIVKTTKDWGELRLALQELVPELKESEDEKIRKELISHFGYLQKAAIKKEVPEKWYGISYDDIIAWLERQKEQSFTHHEIDESLRDAVTHQMEDDGDVDDFVRRGIDDIVLKYAELGAKWQKEQKPVECIEFDNEFKNQVSHLLASVLNKEHDYTEGFVRYVSQSLLEYAKIELKPSEWSEDIIRKAVKEVGLTQHQIDWFKTNVFPPKQEWNEEYREEDLRTRFAFYTYKNGEEDGILYLSNVFVEETNRNKGFGTKILAAAEKVAETIGAITIRLKVKQNSPANAWYRKHGYGYLTFEDGYDWLEKNLEYLKPKQEWNEKDETAFGDLMWCIEQARKSAKDENDMGNIWFAENWLSNRLKSLSPQPKQEWSKEDENAITAAIRACRYMTENFENSTKQYEDAIERLKSIRPKPHWKPSEEQMKALDSAINYLIEHTRTPGNPLLISLYRDLKKL